MITSLQERVVGSTTSLFSHGPRPLADTLSYPGDLGLLGPDSISWEIMGDTSAFVGGIRALLVQTAHPEVVAGVEQHSSYRTDPLGRLTRTSFYVTSTTYGAMPEVEEAVANVRRAHRPVTGRSERGRAYSANSPALMAWVHNVLTDAFLAAYSAFGPRRLSEAEADRFVAEQALIGEAIGADPLPATAAELRTWIESHPEISGSNGQRHAIRFLSRPPLPAAARVGYRFLYEAAASTISTDMATMIGVRSWPTSRAVGRSATCALRWALGSSPSWHLALVRTGAPIPSATFRQPLPEPVSELSQGAH